MKKVLLLFLALSLVGGVAMAQDLGLTAGLEFHIGALNDDNIDAMDSGIIRPVLIWENSDLVENLQLFARVGVPFWMSSPLGDSPWLGVDLTLRGTYNLHISQQGTLGFILASQNVFLAFDDEINGAVRSPAFMWTNWLGVDGITDTVGRLVPGVRYTHALGEMSFYGQLNAPFLLFSGSEDPFDLFGLDFILGWTMNTDFGFLGAELEFTNRLRLGGSAADDFFHWFTVTPFIAFGPLYAEVVIMVPLTEDNRAYSGTAIVPEVRYEIIENLRAFVNLPIYRIGSDHDIRLSLGMGVKFSF